MNRQSITLRVVAARTSARAAYVVYMRRDTLPLAALALSVGAGEHQQFCFATHVSARNTISRADIIACSISTDLPGYFESAFL